MKKTLIQTVIDYILGNKYYANIVNTKGTGKIEICSFIFGSKEQAEKHRKTLDYTRSFLFIETICFRSRKTYIQDYENNN